MFVTFPIPEIIWMGYWEKLGSPWITRKNGQSHGYAHAPVSLTILVGFYSDGRMWYVLIHHRHRQTDGRTDRRTTCDPNTVLCTKVRRAVKPCFSSSVPIRIWYLTFFIHFLGT